MKSALAAVLLAAFAAAGCGSAHTSPSPAPLRLTVVQNPTVSGDSLSFTILLENIGRTAVDLTFPSSCDMLPYFTDGGGREITPAGGGWACLTVITSQHLEPGERLMHSFMVTAKTAPDGQMIVLPPGTYAVHARLLDFEYKLRSDAWPFSLR
jgi:hypothetical protein